MKKSSIVLFITLFWSGLSISQNQSTKISVDFKIKNFGITLNGKFNKANISFDFSSSEISQWTMEDNVQVSTISTNNKTRDAHLLKENYFYADSFPQITLKSRRFKLTSENTYDVDVDLTFKGTTKTLTIPITVIDTNEKFELKSNLEINRRDFDVGGGSLIMSKNVIIDVNYTRVSE